jgi:glycerate dehydrogenase
MKAVILDKATLGNDISYSEIENLCDVKYYETTSKIEIKDRIYDSEIIISNKVLIGKEEMENAPNIKLICVAATGYNNIDISEARKRNIIVSNVKSYSTESVAQTVFGYIFTYFNSTIQINEDIKNGEWQNSPIFTMLKRPFVNISGKKLGVIGFGTIGKRVSEIGKALGMEVLISESVSENKSDFERYSFNYVLENSDVLTIHIPMSDKSKNLFTKNEFSKMKKSAIIINTARGGIINENDLFNALENNDIAFAATDVLKEEPPKNGNILFKAKNIFITPHIAWTSIESRKKLISGIAKNIELFQTGNFKEINLCELNI